jgi:hypothetical protein
MRACALACRSDTRDARFWYRLWAGPFIARLAQLAERKALNLVVVGSSPTSGGLFAKEHICLRLNLAKRCDILIFTCIFFLAAAIRVVVDELTMDMLLKTLHVDLQFESSLKTTIRWNFTQS